MKLNELVFSLKKHTHKDKKFRQICHEISQKDLSYFSYNHKSLMELLKFTENMLMDNNCSALTALGILNLLKACSEIATNVGRKLFKLVSKVLTRERMLETPSIISKLTGYGGYNDDDTSDQELCVELREHQECISTVVSTLQRYQRNVDIQTSGCLLFQVLSFHEIKKSVMIFPLKGGGVIINAIMNFPEKLDLCIAGLGVLYFLLVETDNSRKKATLSASPDQIHIDTIVSAATALVHHMDDPTIQLSAVSILYRLSNSNSYNDDDDDDDDSCCKTTTSKNSIEAVYRMHIYQCGVIDILSQLVMIRIQNHNNNSDNDNTIDPIDDRCDAEAVGLDPYSSECILLMYSLFEDRDVCKSISNKLNVDELTSIYMAVKAYLSAVGVDTGIQDTSEGGGAAVEARAILKKLENISNGEDPYTIEEEIIIVEDKKDQMESLLPKNDNNNDNNLEAQERIQELERVLVSKEKEISELKHQIQLSSEMITKKNVKINELESNCCYDYDEACQESMPLASQTMTTAPEVLKVAKSSNQRMDKTSSKSDKKGEINSVHQRIEAIQQRLEQAESNSQRLTLYKKKLRSLFRKYNSIDRECALFKLETQRYRECWEMSCAEMEGIRITTKLKDGSTRRFSSCSNGESSVETRVRDGSGYFNGDDDYPTPTSSSTIGSCFRDNNDEIEKKTTKNKRISISSSSITTTNVNNIDIKNIPNEIDNLTIANSYNQISVMLFQNMCNIATNHISHSRMLMFLSMTHLVSPPLVSKSIVNIEILKELSIPRKSRNNSYKGDDSINESTTPIRRKYIHLKDFQNILIRVASRLYTDIIFQNKSFSSNNPNSSNNTIVVKFILLKNHLINVFEEYHVMDRDM